MARPKDSDFVIGNNKPKAAVRPRITTQGKQAPSNASNSARAKNRSGANVINMSNKQGAFKSGIQK